MCAAVRGQNSVNRDGLTNPPTSCRVRERRDRPFLKQPDGTAAVLALNAVSGSQLHPVATPLNDVPGAAVVVVTAEPESDAARVAEQHLTMTGPRVNGNQSGALTSRRILRATPDKYQATSRSIPTCVLCVRGSGEGARLGQQDQQL